MIDYMNLFLSFSQEKHNYYYTLLSKSKMHIFIFIIECFLLSHFEAQICTSKIKKLLRSAIDEDLKDTNLNLNLSRIASAMLLA